MIDREKMICSILLLITLTSCVSGSFVVNVRQRCYQAEENHDITLEWTFSPRREGVEVSESQDERFSGRVQFDKDVLREGRLRLHMSRLRTDDSGLYLCDVKTGVGVGSRECHLNVTAARTPNTARGGRNASPRGSPSEPESRGWIVPCSVLGLLVGGILLGVCWARIPDSMNLLRLLCV